MNSRIGMNKNGLELLQDGRTNVHDVWKELSNLQVITRSVPRAQ